MISIIVPVYNAERYIERCVRSIINQTYADWELFIIDDGSKDKSNVICDRLQNEDYRIRCIHKQNQGVSAARNDGLNAAKGDWITFIDADDWVEPFHLQTLAERASTGIDLCINSFIVDLYYGSRPHNYPEIQITNNNKECIRIFFNELLPHSQFLWNKLFRHSIINDNKIRFNTSISLGEDNIFILEYLNYIHGLSSTSRCSYHYVQIDENPHSLGRLKRTEPEVLVQVEANCQAILKLYRKYNMEFLLDHASNYFYTRIFERILVPNTKFRYRIAYIQASPSKYLQRAYGLNCSKIKNKNIRHFWTEIENNKYIKAQYELNRYLLKSWLKSKIIKCVAAAKRAFKSAQRSVSH